MKPSLLAAAAVAAATALGPGAALAKLPAPSDEAKAKAAEAAAKAAWNGKVDAFHLCKVQDKLAAAYLAQTKREGKKIEAPVATPPCADPGPFVYTPPGAASAVAAAAPAPPAAAKKKP